MSSTASSSSEHQTQNNKLPPTPPRYLDHQKLRRVSVIGQGAYGAVYLYEARDATRTRYAVKRIEYDAPKLRASPGDGAYPEEMVRRAHIDQEVRIHRMAQHRNIVPLLKCRKERDSKVYLLIMPYVSGRSLHHRMRASARPFEDRDILRLVREMGAALAYLCGKQILHRDVNPSNILLDGETGAALLADFGLATRSVPSAYRCGTRDYWAPEMHRSGCAYSYPADVWALGVTAKLMAARAATRITRGEKVERFIAQMLREDPSERITAAQLEEQIKL